MTSPVNSWRLSGERLRAGWIKGQTSATLSVAQMAAGECGAVVRRPFCHISTQSSLGLEKHP